MSLFVSNMGYDEGATLSSSDLLKKDPLALFVTK